MRYTVIGGGLAGLTAATALALKGAKVDLFEQHRESGGRAISTLRDGCIFNLGPHALYRQGITCRTLESWGISLSGRTPDLTDSAFFVRDGKRYPFLTGFSRLATTPLLSLTQKLDFASAWRRLTTQAARKPDIGTAEWLNRNTKTAAAREILTALIRLSTYSRSHDLLSFDATRRQMRLSAGGVLYVDGGWQQIVDQLSAAASTAGVRIHTGQTAADLRPGTILATDPSEVERLTGISFPWLRPQLMASLDLALDGLPDNAAKFALCLDQPFYLSVHSEWAKLAPGGIAVVHAAKYLAPGETATRSDLETWCDTVIPNWRARLLHARFLPQMTVVHASPDLASRPAVTALDLPGVCIAGDWVGDHGMLADAAVASGVAAAETLLKETV